MRWNIQYFGSLTALSLLAAMLWINMTIANNIARADTHNATTVSITDSFLDEKAWYELMIAIMEHDGGVSEPSLLDADSDADAVWRLMLQEVQEDDLDANGLPDWWEIRHFGQRGQNPDGDSDNDGLMNKAEYLAGTSPTTSLNAFVDTDADGLSDAWEYQHFAHLRHDAHDDPDGDGLDNAHEFRIHTAPDDVDTDNDGLDDQHEVTLGADPRTADSDRDGIEDWDEVNTYHTKPNSMDSDADDLSDATEIYMYGTDPVSFDTDGDSLADGLEIRFGCDPQVKDNPQVVAGPLTNDLGNATAFVEFRKASVEEEKVGAYRTTDPEPRTYYTFYERREKTVRHIEERAGEPAHTHHDEEIVTYDAFLEDMDGQWAAVVSYKEINDGEVEKETVEIIPAGGVPIRPPYSIEELPKTLSTTFSNEYTTEDFVRYATDQLAPKFKARTRPQESWSSFELKGFTPAIALSTKRDLSSGEDTFTLSKLQFRFRIVNSIAGLPYHFEWVEVFVPEDASKPVKILRSASETLMGNGATVISPKAPLYRTKN